MTLLQVDNLSELFSQLDEFGISRNYARSVLFPDWWDDSAASNPSTFAQLKMIVARRTTFRENVKFKQRKDTPESALTTISGIASGVSRIVASHMPNRVSLLPRDAKSIREDILSIGNRNVSFKALLDYCWSIGIAVVPLFNLPSGKKRVDGIASVHNGTPVIFLTRKQSHESWQLFPLAHEIGHIMKGHIPDGETIIDEVMVSDAGIDTEENEANEFALEVITGRKRFGYPATKLFRPKDLLLQASSAGKKECIDAGFLVLSYGYALCKLGKPKAMAVGNAALKLFPRSEPPISTLVKKFWSEIDFDSLPDDSADYLDKIMTNDDSGLRRQ